MEILCNRLLIDYMIYFSVIDYNRLLLGHVIDYNRSITFENDTFKNFEMKSVQMGERKKTPDDIINVKYTSSSVLMIFLKSFASLEYLYNQMN